MAGGVGCHIGKHHVGAPPIIAEQLVGRVVVKKIELRKGHAGDLRHLQQIDGNHHAFAFGDADTLGSDLAQPPGAAPRSTTESQA